MVQHVKRNWFIYLFLMIITLVVYSRVVDFQLLHYDDNTYITDNSHIRQCVTPDAVKWALSGKYEANWIPLTWLSYMLDYRAYAHSLPGCDHEASVYHRTNLLLHLLNTLLLFSVLMIFTGSRWKSALVAAIFAVHPLHVESVAWVAERKDVLSTFFMMLTLLAYVSYVRRPGVGRYILTALAFTLGLMAKSMLVTLPVLLLLLDFWPLKRLAGSDSDKSSPQPLRKLLIEKLPLFAISLVVGLITITAQEHGGAVRSLVRYPVGERLANAAVSYLAYIGKMVWPAKLACFYPHPHNTIPAWQTAGSVAVLTIATLAAIRLSRRLPQVTVGWMWYLVTLLPVIGIVQVGAQAMADRYMYVPMIGLSIAAVWGAAELIKPKGRQREVALTFGCVILACLAIRAHSQVAFWQDDISLFKHAIEVTSKNSQMEYNLANSYLNEGDPDQAATYFLAAIHDNPYDGQSHNNLAMVLLQQAEGANEPDAYVFQGSHFSREKITQADEHFRAAVHLLPGAAGPHRYLACVLMIEGKFNAAIAEFKISLSISPDSGTEQALQEALAARRAAGKRQ